ncbi:ANTAR domain-containing response regulator [Butyricicoccus sp. Marseille-Q5471]|uniref:ANTAR domain-containing response regulator n=1 Tax=Butyricicoccus sp. Marseille-Q5471 TaxID=3039493 RepID=UPI0024BCEA14|nr:response regulator [Butyricicoccus sp. Marseille-Q5471]
MDKSALRVIIADDEPITRMDLKEILSEKGYDVVGEAADGFDAIELCKQLSPDLVIMDIKMPLLDGLSAARIVFAEELAGTVILLTAYSEREFIDSAKELGVGGYLVKPVDEKSLIPNIELAVARSREMRQLRRDIAKVSERLENRSIIERAKGKIMARDGLTEQESYDYIRKLSQVKNISMRRVAEIVLMQAGG